jgi:hypothetical protein
MMIELAVVDLDEIATALADQESFDHRWLLDPRTGQVTFWSRDLGIDGQSPVDLDELDLIAIDPLPSWVWYQDMADFADGISDEQAGRRLARAIRGRGAFRHFKAELHEEYPELVPVWYAFRDARASCRAVEWLAEQDVVDDVQVRQFLAGHPDPALP